MALRRSLLVLVALALGGTARAQTPSPEAGDALSVTRDSLMVSVAVGLDAAGSEIARIWPGYWPAGQAFALSDLMNTGDVVAVVPRSAAPGGDLPGYERVEGVPRGLYGRTFVRRGGLPGEEPGPGSIPAETVGLGPVQGYIEPFYMVGEHRRPLANHVSLVVHEAFHVWQYAGTFAELDTLRGLVPTEFLDETTFAEDLSVLGQIERENRLLVGVAEAAEPDSMRGLLREYLALRAERLAGRPDLARVERHYERMEGTAEYVGCQAVGAAVSVALVRPCLTSELGVGAEDDHEMRGGVLGYLTRWRLYSVGAVLVDALERLGVDDWRGQIARGERLEALVGDAAGG